MLKRIAAEILPDGKSVVQDDWIENTETLTELKKILQKVMCLKGKGDLSQELQSGIREYEKKYSQMLSDKINKGNSRCRNLYYGMVYTILQDNGFYILGKNGSPICITSNTFCKLFNLNRGTMENTYLKIKYYKKQKKLKDDKSQEWLKTFNIDKVSKIYFELEQKIINL
ncbi:hypothetical protein Bacsa_3104 [Phocaeicola salanitronis DSM 18170]|uniref:Uncharacterized protein n=1 Tax=Phocaeicola salanitronis (strain DSM 18170 / JCM 13657 / CCUG 60908 / BL78) TaxID=667015 RepID=F0R371_PHOSB|nr:hypothetical protein [Phocaeicola salanitronis]ADY37632.1 hypothetical protein Bacsa_3104 [Phocaeicola salanitronis DSM 18170]